MCHTSLTFPPPPPPQARLEYEEAVQCLNSLQQTVFVTQLPFTVSALQTLAENMVTVMHTGLRSFVQMQEVLVHGKQASLPQSNATFQEPFDPVTYVKETIMGSVSMETIPVPSTHIFQEYPFKVKAGEEG